MRARIAVQMSLDDGIEQLRGLEKRGSQGFPTAWVGDMSGKGIGTAMRWNENLHWEDHWHLGLSLLTFWNDYGMILASQNFADF
jgi:hypothetical protein